MQKCLATVWEDDLNFSLNMDKCVFFFFEHLLAGWAAGEVEKECRKMPRKNSLVLFSVADFFQGKAVGSSTSRHESRLEMQRANRS